MGEKSVCNLLLKVDTNGVEISETEQRNDLWKFEMSERIHKIHDEEISINNIETKVYKRRWLQLGLYFIYAAANTSQWIQFSIVANIISRYYGVSSSAVDWTSIVFNLGYVILLFPASYIMDHISLRWTCLIGGIGTTIGAWIKVLSVAQDRFLLLFIGQAMAASMQIFVINCPPQLAATWFGPNEVARATSIGCSGGWVGVSLLFLITPLVVQNHEKIEDIGEELFRFSISIAVVCTVITVSLFLFFEEKPHLPPSKARALQIVNHKFGIKEFISRLKRILQNKSFLLLWNLFGMNLGCFNVTCALLNQLFLVHFENGESDAGKLGLLLTLVGNFGSIIFSIALDKTKKFKELNILIYGLTLLGEILFATGLIMEIKWLVFLSIVIIGISTISYESIGFELSAEATHPEPEKLPSTLLNFAQQVYGTTLVLIVGSLLRIYGDKVAHACLIFILTLGLILTLFTKNDLKRQNASGVGGVNANYKLVTLCGQEITETHHQFPRVVKITNLGTKKK